MRFWVIYGGWLFITFVTTSLFAATTDPYSAGAWAAACAVIAATLGASYVSRNRSE